MDVFDKEIVSFWRSLTNNQVRFILIGGYATNLHGYQRYTGDMDIWIEDTVENRRRLRVAFNEYGMGDYEMIEHMPLVPGWTNFNLNNGIILDLLANVKGLEEFSFDECLQLASIADIDAVSIPFLHINHLIIAKKAVNRPKDQLDIIYLEKIKKLRQEEDL